MSDADLNYILQKNGMGTIESVKAERRAAEAAAKAKAKADRDSKRNANEAAKQQELIDSMIADAKAGNLIVIVGDRNKNHKVKLKSFDEVRCPTCKATIPEARGHAMVWYERVRNADPWIIGGGAEWVRAYSVECHQCTRPTFTVVFQRVL